MSRRGDTWYKREPQAFLDGVQGMGPELIGAYTVILDLMYARDGNVLRDDRHLGGVLGCSKRKAASLTDQLIEAGKIGFCGGNLTNSRAFREILERRKQRETSAKGGRIKHENASRLNKNKELASTNRIEENRREESPYPNQEEKHLRGSTRAGDWSDVTGLRVVGGDDA